MASSPSSDIEQLFGKRADAPEVKTLLSKLGVVEKDLVVDPDDGNAYVSKEKDGFTLLFKDPARIKNPEYSSLPSDSPILITRFLYSEGHDGFSQFPGKLPAELLFTDGREDVAAKLGKPEWQRAKEGKVLAERWLLNGSQIHVTYSKTGNGILVVAHGIPQRF